ncbi:cuscuta receptor 1-like isoform X2 [Carex rostrata]
MEAMKLLLTVAFLVLVLILVQWENVCVSGSDSVQCREEERLALLHINASISFPIHSLEGKWEGKECCQWERVTCDSITGHVTQLDLGISFDYWFDYYQEIQEGILLNATLFLPLRQLRSLSLSAQGIYNCTDGAGLETWANLTKLEILDLSRNSLDGSIIYDLASVPSLRKLDLSRNHINNSLPNNRLETWSNLTKLEILDLSRNSLDGSIIYDLASVPSLRKLDLSINHINNSLPNINGFEYWSNLTKLEMLDLSWNQLDISMLSSLAQVSSLRALYLDYNYNMMGGSFPVKELSALNLEVVSLTGHLYSGSSLDLGHWSSLKALSLADNGLNDTFKLEGLCRLKNIEELDLSFNSFTGNLPSCLGNLSSLKLVDLSHNDLEINFPSSIFERLSSLRYLSLSNNKIEGNLSIRSFFNHSNFEALGLSTRASSHFQVEVVNFPFQLEVLELANCILDVDLTFLYSQKKLQVLDLSNTRSKGPLSAVWFLLENNTNLTQLDLHKNFFTGPFQLPFIIHEKLLSLDISDNLLGRALPANITTKLPNLWYLNLSKNYCHGPLPLISKSNLETLDLSSNNLTDDIHTSFLRIQPSIPDFMDLSNNKFYGSFTDNMNFTTYPLLMLNDNNISGEIPFSICNTSFLVLDISNNELNGVLPNCIAIGRDDLWALKLSRNHLEGSLPLDMCIGQDRWLLDLSDNKLSGSIPPCSNQSGLQIVDLSQNNLTGNFPITWLNISYLMAIYIGENYLSGELPIWIGKGSYLIMLQARQNLFRGPISKQLCQLRYLRILDLSHNNLFGVIPSCIIDMGSTTDNSASLDDSRSTDELIYRSDANFLLHLAYHVKRYDGELANFELKLMSKGRLDIYLEEILLIQSIIDLSSNKLVGNIPEDIGKMNWLITLNLSNNHLSGAIPNSMSNLHQLESLDLSHNSLTGEIPRELTKLTSLESFCVAYNDLSGPTLGVEAQFISFDKSSYEGNPNLCGPPLPRSCVPTGTTQSFPDEMSDDRRRPPRKKAAGMDLAPQPFGTGAHTF